MADILFVRTERYNVTEAIPRGIEAAAGVFDRVSVLGWARDGLDEPPVPADGAVLTTYFRVPMPNGIRRRAAATIAYMRWVAQQIRRQRPDFVQAFDVFAALPAGLVCRRHRTNMIYDVRDPFSQSYPFPFYVRPAAYATDWLTMALATAFVVPAEERIPYLGRWASRRRVCVVRNTCHDELNQLGSTSGLPPRPSAQTIRVACIGYVAPTRGAAALLDLCEQNADVEIWGAGTCRSTSLRERFERIPGAHWLGLVSRPEALTLVRDVDVVALLYDPAIQVNRLAAPNKFYEAMMTGTPVVVSRGMGLANTVARENLGFVIDYDDPRALRRVIGALQDAGRREALRERCRAYFLAHCTLGEELDRYRAFYRRLVAEGTR